MDLIEEIRAGNRRYQEEEFTMELATRPAAPSRKFAVVACMDARYIPERVLGLEPGQAAVVRSAGAVVDEGVLRSLVAAIHLLDVDTIIHLPHTDCGLKGLKDDPEVLYRRLNRHTDDTVDTERLEEIVNWIQPFDDAIEHARDSVARIRTHALIPNHVQVHALLYDNPTGSVEVVEETLRA